MERVIAVSDYDKERDKYYESIRKKAEESMWPDDERIDAIGQNGGTGEHYVKRSKYDKKLAKADIYIDVYDVLDSFDVQNPAIQHALKKMLCSGTRGHKDFLTDIEEAIQSLERAKDFPPIPF